MSEQDYGYDDRMHRRPRPDDQPPPPPRQRVAGADIADEPYDDAPRPRRPVASPRWRGSQDRRLTVALLAVIAVLVLVSIGLGGAIMFGGSRDKSASVASSARPAADGTQAAAASPPGPKIEASDQKTYGDWVYVCLKAPNATASRCQISQQIADSKTKQPLFAWRISEDGNGGLVSEWETRSGVMVDRGIVIDAGTDKPIAVPFRACLPQACTAVARLAPDAIAAFSKATAASATVVPVGGRPIKLALSVKGFSDALAALRTTSRTDAPPSPAPTAEPPGPTVPQPAK